MHMQIVILVRAYDKAAAYEEGDRVIKKLIADGSFDAARVPTVYRYDSEKGESVLQTVFGYQTSEFYNHLAQIRIVLAKRPQKSDDELMEDHDFRFHCWQAGESTGGSIRVYDGDAAGVQDRAHLRNVIEDWPSLVATGQHKKSPHRLWVVSTNVHY